MGTRVISIKKNSGQKNMADTKNNFWMAEKKVEHTKMMRG